jgi:hypothetical protein
MMDIINATPHAINIYVADTDTLPDPAPAPDRTIAPSGTLARAAQTRADVGEIDGVPVGTSVFGAVEGLPAPVAGTWFVVSGLVLAAAPDRPDLLAPARPVRDGAGRVVGCRAFDTTPAGARALATPPAPASEPATDTPPTVAATAEVPTEKWVSLCREAVEPCISDAAFAAKWGVGRGAPVWAGKPRYGAPFSKTLDAAARDAHEALLGALDVQRLSVLSQSGKWGVIIDSPLPGVTSQDVARATSYGLDKVLPGVKAVKCGRKGVQDVIKLVPDPASRVWLRWSQRGGAADVPATVEEVLSMNLQSNGQISIYNLPVDKVEVVAYGYQKRTSSVKSI